MVVLYSRRCYAQYLLHYQLKKKKERLQHAATNDETKIYNGNYKCMVCFVGRWSKVCENQIYPKLSIAVLYVRTCERTFFFIHYHFNQRCPSQQDLIL